MLSFCTEVDVFRKIFYRIIDTLSVEDDFKDRMHDIESRTYTVIVGELNEDTVDKKNKVADQKVAKTIYNSLKAYETSRKKFDVSYFRFK